MMAGQTPLKFLELQLGDLAQLGRAARPPAVEDHAVDLATVIVVQIGDHQVGHDRRARVGEVDHRRDTRLKQLREIQGANRTALIVPISVEHLEPGQERKLTEQRPAPRWALRMSA